MDLLDAGHRHAADMDGGSAASALPLAGAAYQPYVSELLSFSIERLHKVCTPTPTPTPTAPPTLASRGPWTDWRWRWSRDAFGARWAGAGAAAGRRGAGAAADAGGGRGELRRLHRGVRGALLRPRAARGIRQPSRGPGNAARPLPCSYYPLLNYFYCVPPLRQKVVALWWSVSRSWAVKCQIQSIGGMLVEWLDLVALWL